MNERKLIFILGGARSGKSTFALRVAETYGHDVVFIATAEADDDDMATRIARHRAERPSSWRTIEEPRRVAKALAKMKPASTVILDCLTLWVSNLLLRQGSQWEGTQAELDAVLEWYRTHTSTLIVVSNEVGLGIIPLDEMNRTFREWLGWFNQRVAAEADEVYFMHAGLAVNIKALATQLPNPEA